MIGGSEMQLLHQRVENLTEEIEYLTECKVNASDIDYWNSADRYADEIANLEFDLLLLKKEIENYVY